MADQAYPDLEVSLIEQYLKRLVEIQDCKN